MPFAGLLFLSLFLAVPFRVERALFELLLLLDEQYYVVETGILFFGLDWEALYFRIRHYWMKPCSRLRSSSFCGHDNDCRQQRLVLFAFFFLIDGQALFRALLASISSVATLLLLAQC